MPIARLHLKGLSPLTQSRNHGEDRLPSEQGAKGTDAWDERTWRSKLHVVNGSVVIPAFGLKCAIVAGARRSGEQGPGGGKSTWTKHFEQGIAIYEDPPLNVGPEAARRIVISANSDGKRGSGTRVPRRFPQIESWEAVAEIDVIDTHITKEVLVKMATLAGKFIGVGQYRPENGGTNGRFAVVGCDWVEG